MFKRLMLLALMAPAFALGTAFAQERDQDKHGDRDRDREEEEERPDARGEGYEVLGLTTRPYVHALAQRPSDPVNSWSVGVGAGVEIDWEPVWVAADYTIHDVFEEGHDAYSHDGTFAFKLGLYKESRADTRVPMYPHAALVLALPTGGEDEGDDDLSPGFELGVKFIVDPLYVGVDYTLRDLFLAKRDEVYAWNGEFALGLGTHF